ncbi:hypothetical protein QJS04_geneDACA009065 [Acorus gramineus]|uniref:Ferredoxin n=1 Tax=Acorus gramineus TaxID=55184 RepID=A0AAV9APE1_ACOGR|nr:hypothetical protein QJS04_geneDACA009065 [Acorus gramineus]
MSARHLERLVNIQYPEQDYYRDLPDGFFNRGISVTFVDKDGEEKHIKVPIGMSMLEAAHENDIELEGNSRLGCQVIAKPELDGLRLALPMATRNFAVDGFVPKPH